MSCQNTCCHKCLHSDGYECSLKEEHCDYERACSKAEIKRRFGAVINHANTCKFYVESPSEKKRI